MTTWFTADWHIDHVNIITHCARPFANVAEMNKALVANHNAVVAPDDTVVHLGDFFWGPSRDLAGWRKRLNGRQLLVPGNHDRCHSLHSKHRRERDRYGDAGFDVLAERTTWFLPCVGLVMLCHFPLLANASGDVRHVEHRPSELTPGAKWLLCGHVHEKWKRSGKCLNVGVDQWGFRPVSDEELVAEIGGSDS